MTYIINAKPYHCFMGAECEPTFKIEIVKNYFSWKHLSEQFDVIFSVENRDWWVCVQEINKYIFEHNLQNENIIYPDWYRYLKATN